MPCSQSHSLYITLFSCELVLPSMKTGSDSNCKELQLVEASPHRHTYITPRGYWHFSLFSFHFFLPTHTKLQNSEATSINLQPRASSEPHNTSASNTDTTIAVPSSPSTKHTPPKLIYPKTQDVHPQRPNPVQKRQPGTTKPALHRPSDQ